MRFATTLLILSLFALTVLSAGAFYGPVTDPEPIDYIEAGTFLVASRGMADPRFRETVILLLEHDDGGTLGLVVNRITGVTLGEALPDWADLDGRRHFLFLGGPVEMTSLSYLHSAGPGGEIDRWVFDGVSGGFEVGTLRRLLEEDIPVERLRVYVGYAGWGPGQLMSEMARDDWHVFRADPEIVFDPAPDRLWPQFIAQLERSWI